MSKKFIIGKDGKVYTESEEQKPKDIKEDMKKQIDQRKPVIHTQDENISNERLRIILISTILFIFMIMAFTVAMLKL